MADRSNTMTTPRPSSQTVSQLLLLLTLVLLATGAAAAQAQDDEPQLIGRPGCIDKCGNIRIIFPFGIGPGCFRDGFEILCDRSSDPPRVFLAGNRTIEEQGFFNGTDDAPAYKHFSPLELASISLLSGQARAYAPISYFYSTAGDTTGFLTKQFMHLASTPFAVSLRRNRIVGVGWITQPTLSYKPEQQPCVSCRTYQTGGFARNSPNATNGSCWGRGCCEQNLPYQLGGPTQYIELAVLYQGLHSAYALLVDDFPTALYEFSTTDLYGDKTLLKRFPRGVPVALDFAAGKASCPAEGQPLPPDYACVSANSSCANALPTPGYVCECSDGYQGNPYVPNGCQDIDECKQDMDTCSYGGICKNTPGGYDCPCKFGLKGDGNEGGCETVFTPPVMITLGAVGPILLMVIILYLVILKEKKKMKELYENNGGPTLEKANGIKLFKKWELKPILKNSNLIGKGCFGEVYKGHLDNELVAIKKTITGSVPESEQFANEVIIQSRVIHKNIVRLIGCCLEVDAPMLVYEFISQGSLHDILHDNDNKVALNLDTRLNIAAQSAEGLAYMHSKAHTRILHGDVKPANILLDDNFVPKISDFGISRLIARDKEHTGLVIGDMNYMDPVYLKEGLLTEKSDVYSFGIVILEVISRKKDTHADDFSLLKSFLEVHKQGKKATNLFDTEISVAGDLELLDCLAEIAVECLNLDVNQRPSMTDVAERLLILSRSHGLHARHTVDKTRRADYSFVTGISSSLAEQDTNLHGTTISSSVSTGLYKFNNLDIFNRKGRRKFDRNVTHTLQKSHFIKIFKKEEIREIIRSSTSIEKGAFSEVYKGVADDALVAVKKMLDSNALKSKRLEDKVIIQSQIIHKNIVRLIGYCLEMDSPVLVYEFLSSGTLHDILHSGSMVPLNLDVRLSMVAESAQGLAYLHSHTHCRILHGDVRPANILLDDNFMPKITIVDASPMEEPEYIQTIRVDLAYMDPVYLQTGILTEESDVYSFGIVILEVISRKFPANNGSLVRSFLGIHKKGKKATELFDKEIAVSGNWEILDCLAEIAVQCLSPDRDERPTMTDVAERLVTLQRYRRSQVVRQ